MIYEPLIELVEQQVPELTFGKNLFLNRMPIDIDPGILFRDAMSGTAIDGDTGLRRGHFTVVSRGRDYQNTKALLESVMAILTISVETDFDGFQLKSMRPLGEPFSYMLSAGNAYELSVNVMAIYAIVRE